MDNLQNNKIWQEVTRYTFMVIACLTYSLSLIIFLIPNGIVGGGVSGAASLINILTGLPTGIFIVIINIPILLLGLKIQGWRFILRCLITTITLGLATEFWNIVLRDLHIITEDKILASIYGGVLQGIGIGLFIKYETSSGGTELLGRITHTVLPFGSIPTHVAILDGIVVVVGAFALSSIENVMYALILIFVSAKISDIVVLGFGKSKLCYIITDKADEIAEYMIHHSPRGITKIDGEGMYSKSDKKLLLTCVRGVQVAQLKAVVKSIDEGAFVIVCDANEVYGKGFNRM